MAARGSMEGTREAPVCAGRLGSPADVRGAPLTSVECRRDRFHRVTRVRLARAGDAEVLAGIHFRANWQAYGELTAAPPVNTSERDRWVEEQVEGYRRHWRRQLAGSESDHPTFVVEVKEGVVGFCEVVRHPGGDVGEIVGLYVEPELWRKGLGRVLVDQAVEWFEQHGVATAVLWALEPAASARAFYEALGWHADGARRTEPSVVTGVVAGIRYHRDLTS